MPDFASRPEFDRKESPMRATLLTFAIAGLVLVVMPAASPVILSGKAAAHTTQNWSRADRQRYCSQRAERYANRQTRRTTAAGALTGAAAGGIIGGNRRGTGLGALAGGGAGLATSNARWTSIYDRYMRNCMSW
jgi:outer membrane lipoprotein SlyB